jgi:hypothetical protein
MKLVIEISTPENDIWAVGHGLTEHDIVQVVINDLWFESSYVRVEET